MALCFGFHPTALSQFLVFYSRISNFLDLSITEETWVVEMQIWWIKIGNVLVLHSGEDRQTDDGQQAIRNAHLSFQLRWAKT
jgi:hypothetical protein